MNKVAWGGAALWLLVVTVGAGVAWIAIDRAGQQISTSGPSLSTPSPAPTDTTRVPATPRSSQPPSTASSPTAPTSPTPARAVRTWSGQPGSLTVACVGTTGRLVSATPADGWRVDHGGSDSRVEVTFESGAKEVEVRATCATTKPVFEVRADD